MTSQHRSETGPTEGGLIVGARGSSLGLLPVIVCFAAVLWLAAACGDGADKESSSGKEETGTTTAEHMDEDDPCEAISPAEEGSMATTPEITDERIHEVRLKYDNLFWRQPNVFGVGEGYFKDENGEWTETSGIIIRVTEKVDQSTLPPEDRIPDCLEGIPVQIIEQEPWQWAALNVYLVPEDTDTASDGTD